MREAVIGASIERLVRKGLIEESEKELYIFGMYQLVLFFINIATSIAIGYACGMLWQSVLFSLAYIPLRRYAGGYHAKTPRRCYILSILLIISALMLVRYMPFFMITIGATWLVAFTIIFIKAPLESENKPLSDGEKIVFKKAAHIIAITESCIMMGLIVLSFDTAAKCVGVAIIMTAVLLIIPAGKHKKVYIRKIT